MPGFLDTATGLWPSAATLQALSGAWPQASADPGRRYPSARRTRLMLDQARSSVAARLAIDPAGVFFASDRGTAIWWALTGFRRTHPRLVVSPVEDLSVLRTADVMASQGTPLDTVAVDRAGRVDPEAVGALLAADPVGPATVVVQDGNLEIGTRQPLAGIRDQAAGHLLVVDLQAVAGRVQPFPDWDIAFAEARMWGGPPGVAIVAVRTPLGFRPAQTPTDGHGGVEPGYPAVPLIAAAALALENPDPGWAATAAVTDHLRERVTANIADVVVLGHPTHRLPYLTMFSFLYVSADEMVDALAQRGWSVASGASCTSDTLRPHHVLVAVRALTHGSLRVSVGPRTTSAQIDDFVADLVEVVARARADAGATDL